MDPKGPCFITGPQSFFTFEPEYDLYTPNKLLTVLKGFFYKMTVYDCNGRMWISKEVQPDYDLQKWKPFRSDTEGSPKFSVAVLWQQPKLYTLTELKIVYCKAVDENKEMYSPSVDPKTVKRKVSEAFSFEELMHVYFWMEKGKKGGDSKVNASIK